MSLAQLDLSVYDTPLAPVAPDRSAQDFVMLKRTRAGHLIAVCTLDQAPQIFADECAEMVDAETGRKGVPLFTPPEIRRMVGCDPAMLEHILEVKRAFPGATVMSILDEVTA